VGTAPSQFVADAQEAATETGVTYVDHFDFVLREYEALGETAVNSFYPVDHLHTNAAGADIVAQTFVRGVLCDSTNPLFSFVSNRSVVPSEYIHIGTM
jgi:rhamnogalacturonan acetylesterase